MIVESINDTDENYNTNCVRIVGGLGQQHESSRNDQCQKVRKTNNLYMLETAVLIGVRRQMMMND